MSACVCDAHSLSFLLSFPPSPIERLNKSGKQEEEEDSDGGFKRRPKLRTTIALDQRYTWAAAPTACQDTLDPVSKGYIVSTSRRLPNSFAPDPLILSQSSFPDRYPHDPALHFVPRHAIPVMPPHMHQQQQYQIHQLPLQQPIPASQISDNFYRREQVNGYPIGASVHQIPIYPPQIPCRRTTDVSEYPSIHFHFFLCPASLVSLCTRLYVCVFFVLFPSRCCWL